MNGSKRYNVISNEDGSGMIAKPLASDLPPVAPVRVRRGVQCHCPMDDCVALVACTEGRLAVSLGAGAAIRLVAGDACLMPARSQYCVEASRGCEGAELMISVADLMERHAEVIGCAPALVKLISNEGDGRAMLLRGLVDESCAQLIESMFSESSARDVLFRESLECSVRQLAILIARAARDAVRTDGEPLSVDAVITYLNENLESATLASTARHFSYHPNTVAQLIKRSCGKTFCELVTELRMERAGELVGRSSIPVQRIAEACGYRNMTHFYDLFRRVFNCTPGEYRSALAA